MTTKSPLARFFNPVGGKGGSPPKTPGPGFQQSSGDLKDDITPPRSTEMATTRKRGAAAAVAAPPDAKKPRAEGEEAAPMDTSAAQLQAGSSSEHLDQHLDLAATLQKANTSQGGLPPFIAECFHHFATGGAQYAWPPWLLPENIRDIDGRLPSDPAYNQCTLQVPDEKEQKATTGHGTPMLLQYWKLKSSHFDKIAFFKVGKFYELFYYDAFIAQRVCDLKWMGEKKPHVGFPEMAKHDYAKKIVAAGYKVVVVEQVERVIEQKERKNAANDKGPSCVEREACEVFTNGTLVDPELLGGAAAKFMICFYFEEPAANSPPGQGGRFAACMVDVATSQIQLGIVKDSADRNALRTLLAQVQPSEVVYNVTNMPPEVLGMVKRLPCRPQLSPVYDAKCGDVLAAKNTLVKYRKEHEGKLQPVEAALTEDSACIAAAGSISYLESVLLGKRVLPFATWEVLAPVHNPLQPTAAQPNGVSRRLVLDATALQALEVLETLEGTFKGSLLHYLDHTSTDFGFRMLKQWLCAPLFEIEEIRTRGEAVEFFISHMDLAQSLRNGLKKVPLDLERVTSRIWSFALQAERHAVMYEDITAKRLGEFRSLLLAYEQCLNLLDSALPESCSLPARLHQIVRIRSKGGSFPELRGIISQLSGSIVEDRSAANGKVKFRPQTGAYKPYDELTQQIATVKADLEKELEAVKKRFPGIALTFVHRLPGFRYEIEAEDKALPHAYLKTVEETFRNKTKVRFHTPRIKELLPQLDALEDRREDCIFPFLAQVFRQFYGYHAQFRAAVRCISELDALLSLSLASQDLSGASCRPEFVEVSDPEAAATLELRGCRHPVAAAKMGTSFVPNDTVLNACEVPNVLVVTGPNMGGKSTVLRQTCIAVIMAQLGCRVNAEKCRLSPIDRVFTRIGSYDTILEGKSTLLTELEETSAILAHGSRRSLAVLDELGRGTSTFDGAAIASAVLDELKDKVHCLVLFATHYHPVSREAAKSPLVQPFHMAAAVDEKSHDMTFLYRFLPGLCPASHGHNVAKLAGLPAGVLQDALAKSAEFEGGGTTSVRGTFAMEVARLAEAGDVEALKALFERRPRAATKV